MAVIDDVFAMVVALKGPIAQDVGANWTRLQYVVGMNARRLPDGTVMVDGLTVVHGKRSGRALARGRIVPLA